VSTGIQQPRGAGASSCPLPLSGHLRNRKSVGIVSNLALSCQVRDTIHPYDKSGREHRRFLFFVYRHSLPARGRLSTSHCPRVTWENQASGAAAPEHPPSSQERCVLYHIACSRVKSPLTLLPCIHTHTSFRPPKKEFGGIKRGVPSIRHLAAFPKSSLLYANTPS